jgi:hypothetical protein
VIFEVLRFSRLFKKKETVDDIKKVVRQDHPQRHSEKKCWDIAIKQARTSSFHIPSDS